MTARRRIAFARIGGAALVHADTLVRRWLPDGRREGAEWVAINPTRSDNRKGSFNDVTETVGGLRLRDSAKVVHKPRLLSDNGSSYISSDLAEWLKDRGIAHVRGALCHPQTQGKIERWHQTLKNRILLENYYLPGDLEAQIARFVEHYNHRRYHESLLLPACHARRCLSCRQKCLVLEAARREWESSILGIMSE